MKLVGIQDLVVADIEGYACQDFEHTGTGKYAGTLHHIGRLYWSHKYAIKYLQGALLQNLIGPNYAVLRAAAGESWAPRPHIRDVSLAYITQAPDVGLDVVVFELGSRFC